MKKLRLASVVFVASVPFIPTLAMAEEEAIALSDGTDITVDHQIEAIDKQHEEAHHKLRGRNNGEWSVQYETSNLNLEGIINRNKETESETAFTQGYKMTGETANLVSQDVVFMYGMNQKLTLSTRMSLRQNSVSFVTEDKKTHDASVSGLGDTAVSAIYNYNENWIFELNASLPTGNPATRADLAEYKNSLLPIVAQLGTGTYDVKTGAVVHQELGKFDVGMDGSFVHHFGYNQAGYHLGDRMDGATWVKYDFSEKIGTIARISGSYAGKNAILSSSDMYALTNEISDYNPDNSGGLRMDASLGLEANYKSFSAEMEYGIPVYEFVHSMQIAMHSVFVAGIQATF